MRTADPLGDAITVLEAVSIGDPSSRPDTEDAHNRVRLAVEYLRMAREIMRDLAKENYVLNVITKLGDYDRAEVGQARLALDAIRSALAEFDEWERSSRFAREAGADRTDVAQ